MAIYDEVRATVEWIGDAGLRQFYAQWSEVQDRREAGMLENINGYRKAMVEKVQEQPGIGASGVSWNLESSLD